MLPNTEQEAAVKLSERLRQNPADDEFEIHTAVAKAKLSIGMAVWTGELDTRDDLFRRANNDGRNQVSSYTEE